MKRLLFLLLLTTPALAQYVQISGVSFSVFARVTVRTQVLKIVKSIVTDVAVFVVYMQNTPIVESAPLAYFGASRSKQSPPYGITSLSSGFGFTLPGAVQSVRLIPHLNSIYDATYYTFDRCRERRRPRSTAFAGAKTSFPCGSVDRASSGVEYSAAVITSDLDSISRRGLEYTVLPFPSTVAGTTTKRSLPLRKEFSAMTAGSRYRGLWQRHLSAPPFVFHMAGLRTELFSAVPERGAA